MSNQITIKDTTVDIGQAITFHSHVPDGEGKPQSGIVLGVVDYETAAMLDDVAAVNNSIDTEGDYKSEEITAEEFVLIKAPNGMVRPWYSGWITNVEKTGETSTLLRVYYDTDTPSLADIKNTLHAANISFRVEN